MVEFFEDSEAMQAHLNDPDQMAYLKLKPEIDAKYPKDWFIGIYGSKIVANAASFEALTEELAKIDLDKPDVLVVQSGEDTGELIIL